MGTRSTVRRDRQVIRILGIVRALLNGERLTVAQTQLRFGDAEAYHRYSELMERMRSMLDRIVKHLEQRFHVKFQPGRPGKDYAYQSVSTEGLLMDLGLILGGRDEANRPIWPVLHVHPDSESAKKAQSHTALPSSKKAPYPAWPGLCQFPTNEQMTRFLGAWEWEDQVRVGIELAESWFEALAATGLVKRKG